MLVEATFEVGRLIVEMYVESSVGPFCSEVPKSRVDSEAILHQDSRKELLVFEPAIELSLLGRLSVVAT